MTPILPAELRIEVSEADLAEGIAGSCRHCPIAIAIRRALRALAFDVSFSVEVRINEVEINGREYALPLLAVGFIRAIDARRSCLPCRPFGFDLDLSSGVPVVRI